LENIWFCVVFVGWENPRWHQHDIFDALEAHLGADEVAFETLGGSSMQSYGTSIHSVENTHAQ
jgi:hypothetical protein